MRERKALEESIYRSLDDKLGYSERNRRAKEQVAAILADPAHDPKLDAGRLVTYDEWVDLGRRVFDDIARQLPTEQLDRAVAQHFDGVAQEIMARLRAIDERARERWRLLPYDGRGALPEHRRREVARAAAAGGHDEDEEEDEDEEDRVVPPRDDKEDWIKYETDSDERYDSRRCSLTMKPGVTIRTRLAIVQHARTADERSRSFGYETDGYFSAPHMSKEWKAKRREILQGGKTITPYHPRPWEEAVLQRLIDADPTNADVVLPRAFAVLDEHLLSCGPLTDPDILRNVCRVFNVGVVVTVARLPLEAPFGRETPGMAAAVRDLSRRGDGGGVVFLHEPFNIGHYDYPRSSVITAAASARARGRATLIHSEQGHDGVLATHAYLMLRRVMGLERADASARAAFVRYQRPGRIDDPWSEDSRDAIPAYKWFELTDEYNDVSARNPHRKLRPVLRGAMHRLAPQLGGRSLERTLQDDVDRERRGEIGQLRANDETERRLRESLLLPLRAAQTPILCPFLRAASEYSDSESEQ
jgi:hypothetical protein